MKKNISRQDSSFNHKPQATNDKLQSSNQKLQTTNHKPISRRLFINRSVAATSGALLLANVKTWPAWAEASAFEGAIGRMGRIAHDPEDGRTWVSWLQVDVTNDEISTEFGPACVTHAVDKVMVKSRTSGRYTKPYDVSAGQKHAKLDPRIDARGGRACVVWAGCDLDTRRWRVFAARCDGSEWSSPEAVTSLDCQALHPSVALDPETGAAWIAFEDWNDGAIYLANSRGPAWSKPIKISECGANYRPKVIVTRKQGKNSGAVAVAWDSYRDHQYDVYLRLLAPDGAPGPELRATSSGRWDSCADLAEDRDGGLWLAWVRASNELTEMDSHRQVMARCFDNGKWLWPLPAADLDSEVPGRLTRNSCTWHPKILVDGQNRVHVCYREGTDTLVGKLKMRTYAGNAWSRPRRMNLGPPKSVVHMIWDFSAALAGPDRIEGVWDSVFTRRLGFASQVGTIKPTPLPAYSARQKLVGVEADDAPDQGWPQREKPETRVMDDRGRSLMLLFGDTHTHSWSSDGADPADWNYHFARDFARLDFFALSDHDFTICNTPGLEAYIAFLPRAFTSPEFICFQAYEFTSQSQGHRVVVFEGKDKMTFAMARPPMQKSETTGYLYHFMRKFDLAPHSRVLVTAHNMYQIGNEFGEYDEALEPLYDAASLHVLAEKPFRDYEPPGGRRRSVTDQAAYVTVHLINQARPRPGMKSKWCMCWREALDTGAPLGAYGASDTHISNAVGFVVTGLWAEKKDRAAIFDAMFARRSFATDSGLRLIQTWNTSLPVNRPLFLPMLRADVRFFLDDHFMGGKPRISAPPLARAAVYNHDASDPVRALVFVKDGREAHTEHMDGANPATAQWKDPELTPGRHYYYVRADFKSGNTAYSSPVFANY
jgi:hypothetical protein